MLALRNVEVTPNVNQTAGATAGFASTDQLNRQITRKCILFLEPEVAVDPDVQARIMEHKIEDDAVVAAGEEVDQNPFDKKKKKKSKKKVRRPWVATTCS